MLRLRGMISTFTHDDNNPLDHYLLLPDEQFEKAPIPLAELRAKATEQKARTTADTLEWKEDNGVLTSYHVNILNDFVTYLRNTMEHFEEKPDIRTIIPENLLSMIFDNGLPADFVSDLKRLHKSDLTSMFVLRTTKGPTRKCINFHVDGDAATRTLQIPLNDPSQYKGGKLVFFIDDKIVAPPRTPGSLTIHHRDVLHGVTSVQQGVRNSFFIIDDGENSKGRAISYEGVPTLKESIVTAYNSRNETKELKNSLAQDRITRLQQESSALKSQNKSLKEENKRLNDRVEELVVEADELKAVVYILEEKNEELKENCSKFMGSTVDSLNMIQLQKLKQQLFTAQASVTRREIALYEEEQREKLCVICDSNPKNIILRPCNHVCLCEDCVKRLRGGKCPMCQSKYGAAEKLYI